MHIKNNGMTLVEVMIATTIVSVLGVSASQMILNVQKNMAKSTAGGNWSSLVQSISSYLQNPTHVQTAFGTPFAIASATPTPGAVLANLTEFPVITGTPSPRPPALISTNNQIGSFRASSIRLVASGNPVAVSSGYSLLVHLEIVATNPAVINSSYSYGLGGAVSNFTIFYDASNTVSQFAGNLDHWQVAANGTDIFFNTGKIGIGGNGSVSSGRVAQVNGSLQANDLYLTDNNGSAGASQSRLYLAGSDQNHYLYSEGMTTVSGGTSRSANGNRMHFGEYWGRFIFEDNSRGGTPISILTMSGVSGIGTGSGSAGLATFGTDAYPVNLDAHIIYSDGSALSSDRRLKEKIQTISEETSLNFIKKLRPVQYEMKSDHAKQYGFIAQEIIKAGFSEFVSSIEHKGLFETVDKDGFVSPKDRQFSVDYQHFTSILTRASQYFLEKISKHDSEINKLKSENDALKAYLCVRDPKAKFCVH